MLQYKKHSYEKKFVQLFEQFIEGKYILKNAIVSIFVIEFKYVNVNFL